MKNQKTRGGLTIGLIAFLVMALLMSGAAISAVKDKNKQIELDVLDLLQKEQELSNEIDSLESELKELHTLSVKNVEYWIDTLKIAHGDIVMRQVWLETGNLGSAICNENNNLFGMKEPRIRETTALGTKRGHAYYKNYIESIKDYKLWQEARGVGDDIDYYHFLASVGYAEAPNYIKTLKSI